MATFGKSTAALARRYCENKITKIKTKDYTRRLSFFFAFKKYALKQFLNRYYISNIAHT